MTGQLAKALAATLEEGGSPKERERKVLDFWQERGVFKASLRPKNKGKKAKSKGTFVFYEGPPSANGLPGLHHVLGRTIKDIFCRYKTMQGYIVPRRAGWDAHGLPIELEVEKQLGITKKDIGQKVSVEAYNKACRKAVMRYKDAWDGVTRAIGFWLDLDKPYVTCDRAYVESVWSLLARLYERDLLYKGTSIQPYSPAAGTSLSQHELNQPGCYKEVKDLSLTVQFKVKGSEATYFLSWTTTPWTLPANNALAVGKDIRYAKVRTLNPYTFEEVYVILAEDCLPTYFAPDGAGKPIDKEAYQETKSLPYEVTDRCKGRDLMGMEYEQLMPYVPLQAPALRVYAGDFVTTKEGTGVVHIASTFGADDHRLSKEYNLPEVRVVRDGKSVPIVDEEGRFVREITDFSGRYVKAAYGKKSP